MSLKHQIVEESLKLFTLKGFLSTSLNDILAAAQTSKGGFYNHFSSKDALFFDVLELARSIWRERTLAGLETIASPAAKLIAMLRNYRDLYLSDTRNMPGGCPFIKLAVELSDQKPELASALDRGFAGLKRMILRLVQAGQQIGELNPTVDAEATADFIFAGMLGASVRFGVDKSNRHLDAAIEGLVDYINGMCGSFTINQKEQ